MAVDTSELMLRLTNGDRSALSRAITLVESRNPAHRETALQLLDACLSREERSFRFAISGAPGVGKSTFIEALGKNIVQSGQSLAVLTIDPSSRVSGGAILGDKTRMSQLSMMDNVFIRPSPAGDSLGGVADATRESIALCEAAGFENICIETVGVGQSEVTVRQMCDFMLLLVLPGGGDSLQGIKRGIVELTDMIAINKADGDQLHTAKRTQQGYQQAIHLYPKKQHEIPVSVLTCSALDDSGIDAIWSAMLDFHRQVSASGYLEKNRLAQDVQWLYNKIDQLSRDIIFAQKDLRKLFDEMKHEISEKRSSVSSAYKTLRDAIHQKLLS